MPTDLGICCSFNHQDVLRQSEFSQLLRTKREDVAKVEEEDGDMVQLAEIGVRRGLEVYVDQHSNRVTAGSVSSPSKYDLLLTFLCFPTQHVSVSSRF